MIDIKDALDTIWSALHDYRENSISEGDEYNDEVWSDICTAMAVIQEDLQQIEKTDDV